MAAISHERARALLGVDRRASEADIRRAYRRQARRHHPDAGGDADTFRDLVAAVDLLLDAPTTTAAPSSPSTGRRAYPSTDGRHHSSQAADPPDVDRSVLADATVPAIGARWSRGGVAAAVLAAGDATGPDRIAGTSRRPGSWLNRVARHLSDDLLATWEVTGATRRGVPGRDLEVVASFPPGARRHVERSSLPSGWSTTRNPAGTVSTCVVRPAGDAATTAILVADTLDAACNAMDWPLSDWLRTA